MNNGTNKAIFFDRDGTIIVDKNYLKSPSEVEYLPGFFEAYSILLNKGFETFLITNQSGVSRGYFTMEDVSLVHHQIQTDLINHGLKPFREIKICPHEPKDQCSCRKPNPQMALELIEKYQINPELSYMLGDKQIDLDMATNAKLKGILILSHQSPETSIAPTYSSVLSFSQSLN
jgi:D,D-heptose 1,7-bisphosphate phosphatase